MSKLELSIVQESNEEKRAGNKLDYLPFGVKTLKIKVSGDYEGKLRLAPKRFALLEGEKLGHEDDGMPPQFVVFWGGGYEDYYLLDYPEKRTVHFFVRHIGDGLDDYPLTIQACLEGSDEVIGCLEVTLTHPAILDETGVTAEKLVKARWQETRVGRNGASDVILAGRYAPNYISRWWPHNQVVYDTYETEPPRVRLHYERLVEDNSGRLTVYTTSPLDGTEYPLAVIQGSIHPTLYDMQQVVPELYRFASNTWALRVWFLWLDKDISLDDLERYGTRTPKEIKQTWQEITPKTEGGLAEQSWAEAHEIPDAERVDIIFDYSAQARYAATDLHWREMWGEYEEFDEPLQVQIMNTRPADLLKDRQATWKVITVWSKVLLSQILPRDQSSKVYNPQPQVAEALREMEPMAADPTTMESHTPAFFNVSMQVRFTSTDVRDG